MLFYRYTINQMLKRNLVLIVVLRALCTYSRIIIDPISSSLRFVEHVVTNPGGERVGMNLLFESRGEEVHERMEYHKEFKGVMNYLDEYDKMNNGSNPTKATMMLSRMITLENIGLEVFSSAQNSANSTTAITAAEYSADNAIPLDCNKVDGHDHELCLATLRTTTGFIKCFENRIDRHGGDTLSFLRNEYSFGPYVVAEPGAQQIVNPRLVVWKGNSEQMAYLEEYTKVNDGTNPTKAIVMSSRLIDSGGFAKNNRSFEHLEQNWINSKAAIVGAKESVRLSITLDCDRVSGSDSDLCLSMQRTPIFEFCPNFKFARNRWKYYEVD